MLAMLALPLCGCMSMGGGASKAIAAMAKDPATFKCDVDTVYGKVHLVRIGYIPGQFTTVNADGSITVTGQGTNLFTTPLAGTLSINPVKP